MLQAQLAPAFLVRTPCFPIETLDAFGRGGPFSSTANAAGEYEQLVAAERLRLCELTIGNEAFMKALLISNPGLAERASMYDPRRKRTKRERHMETTLYRHLARGAGRATPNGCWAASGLGHWSERTQVGPAQPSYVVSPDLMPFQSTLRALAFQPWYLEASEFVVNQTLRTDRSGEWLYWRRRRDGRVTHSQLRVPPALNRCLCLLSGMERGTLLALAGACAADTDVDAREFLPMLHFLVRQGVLTSTLDFPPSYATAWRALSSVVDSLREDHRVAWVACCSELKSLSAKLEADLDSMTYRCLAELMESARRSLGGLIAALQVTVPLPRAVFLVDKGMGAVVELGEEIRESLRQSLIDSETVNVAYGLGVSFRRGLWQVLARTDRTPSRRFAIDVPSDPSAVRSFDRPKTWQAFSQQTDMEALLAPAIARWEDLLAAGGEIDMDPGVVPAVASDSLPPLGTLIVNQVPLAASSAPLQRDTYIGIAGCMDQVMPSLFRTWQLFNPSEGDDRPVVASDPLTEWLTGTLRRLSVQSDTVFLDYRDQYRAAPNLLIRPPIDLPEVDLLGFCAFRSRDIEVKASEGRPPYLRLPNGHRAVAFVSSAIPFAKFNSAASWFLRTTFNDWPLSHAPGALIFEQEYAMGESPSVVANGRTRLRAHRWLVRDQALTSLVSKRGAERFAAWQSLARAMSWPATIVVRRDGGRPLLVRRDSPLAVEAALEGLVASRTTLVVEQPPQAWLELRGCHYMAELLVPFERERHAWTKLGRRRKAIGVAPDGPGKQTEVDRGIR